ncbi:MAG TPA: phosphopantetheine-binding protein [Steroidobacteraceae bacterium]
MHEPAPPLVGDKSETATGVALCEIWSGVLGLESLEWDQNFFELGGQSEDAMEILARVTERLKCTLPLTALFQFPTIRQMARLIELQRLGKESDALSDITP